MLLKNIMKTNVVTTTDNATIREAAKELTNRGVGCLLVIENDLLKGIVTKGDIVRSLADKKDPDYCKVSEIMTTNVVNCSSDINIYTAAKILTDKKVKRLAILKEGKLEGIVSLSDIAPTLHKEIEEISCYFWEK